MIFAKGQMRKKKKSTINKMTANLDTTLLRLNSRAAANMGLAKVTVQWLIEHLCFVSSAVLADSFVLRIRYLRQAQNRYKK